MLKSKSWIPVAIITALLISFAPVELMSPVFIFILGLSIGLFTVLLLQGDSEDCVFLFNIFILAFLARIVMSVFLFNFVFLRNGTGLLGDAWPYSDNGYNILKLWERGIKDFDEIELRLISINNAGNLGVYDIWNAMIYSFTGRSPLSVIFINCLATSLTVILVYDIARQIYDERAAKFAAILTAFWPSIFLWSIQNLKESISTFLLSLLVWAYVRLKKRLNFYLIFLGVLTVLALKEFRGIAFLVFVIALAISFLLPILKSRKIEGFILIILIAMGYFLFIANIDIKSWLSDVVNTKIDKSFLDFLYEKRTGRAYGGTAFLADFDFRNPFKIALYIPAGLLVAWFAPFPWQLGSMLQIISLPEMLCYYVLLFYMIAGIKYVVGHKISQAGMIVILVFVMQIVFAMAEGNIGTLFRHRSMILPLIFVLGSIGFLERKKVRNAQ